MWDRLGRNVARVSDFRQLGLYVRLHKISTGPDQDELSYSYGVAINLLRRLLYSEDMCGYLFKPGHELWPIPKLWWSTPAAGEWIQLGGMPTLMDDPLIAKEVQACGVDLQSIRAAIRYNVDYDNVIPILIEASEVDRFGITPVWWTP